jgi:hypothetical protein
MNLPIPGTPEYDQQFREIFQRIPKPIDPRDVPERRGFPVTTDEEIRL